MARQHGVNASPMFGWLRLRKAERCFLPAYDPDDGPLSEAQLDAIRCLAGRQEIESVSSTLL